jgi:hypothetical protein
MIAAQALYLIYAVFAQGMFAIAVGLVARHVMHRRSRWWVTSTVVFGPFAMLVLLLVRARQPGDRRFLA